MSNRDYLTGEEVKELLDNDPERIITSLRTALSVAVEALKERAVHADFCASGYPRAHWADGDAAKCTCKLGAALAAARAVGG